MTATPAHPAIRLPVGRLAPIVVGSACLAAVVFVGVAAIFRPDQLITAGVGTGAVVVATAGMYAILATLRVNHLLTLTTAIMGLSMARLIASVALGMAYMLLAGSGPVVAEAGASLPPTPDKFVFAVGLLGVSLTVLAVETPLLRAAVHRLGELVAGAASTPAGSTDASHSAQSPSATPTGAHR